MNRPLIIVGLQKSGTSLLKKILATSAQLVNLFPAEGNGLWGNVPPFSPEQSPVGTLYQQHRGQKGHCLTAEDFLPEDAKLIQERLEKELSKHAKQPAWLTKNPYLTVRLAWLKQVFPDAVVVACLRKPLPNVFSLYKRYTHALHGRQPEQGWWGVKPENWQQLVDPDSLITAARQWQAINQQLLADRHHVDCIVPYHQLTTEPDQVLSCIEAVLSVDLNCQIPMLQCLDDEWQTGGSAVSANQEDTTLLASEAKVPGLSGLQIERVGQYCDDTWEQWQAVIS